MRVHVVKSIYRKFATLYRIEASEPTSGAATQNCIAGYTLSRLTVIYGAKRTFTEIVVKTSKEPSLLVFRDAAKVGFWSIRRQFGGVQNLLKRTIC